MPYRCFFVYSGPLQAEQSYTNCHWKENAYQCKVKLALRGIYINFEELSGYEHTFNNIIILDMKIKEGFILRDVCGEHVVTGEGLVNINFNKLISLNETAAFLWKAVEGKEFSVRDMAQLLVDEYGIDMDLATKDSDNLAKAWIEAGIVE